MPETDLLVGFVLSTAVFAYMPGPSTLYAAAQTIARGRREGLLVAFGIHIGGYVHVFAAALGLAALFEAIPILYSGLKLAGAAYLIWLGIKLFLNQEPVNKIGHVAAKSPKRAFWESATVEILNPKTAVFYLAFLPQFTDLSASLPLWAQLIILGTIVNIMFSSADLLCVFLAERINVALQRGTSLNRIANRLGGGILIGLGINLVASR